MEGRLAIAVHVVLGEQGKDVCGYDRDARREWVLLLGVFALAVHVPVGAAGCTMEVAPTTETLLLLLLLLLLLVEVEVVEVVGVMVVVDDPTGSGSMGELKK